MYFLSVVFVILRSFAYTHTSCDSRWTDSALLSTGRRFQTRYFHDGCGSHKQPRYVASNGSYNLCFPKGREGLFNDAYCKFYNSKGNLWKRLTNIEGSCKCSCTENPSFMSIDHESVFVTKSYVVGRTNDQSGWHGFLRVGKKEGLMSKKQDFAGYDRTGQTDDELDHWAATNSGVVLKVSLGGSCGLVGVCILLYFLYRLLRHREPSRVEPTRTPPSPLQRRATEYPPSGVRPSAPPPPYTAKSVS